MHKPHEKRLYQSGFICFVKFDRKPNTNDVLDIRAYSSWVSSCIFRMFQNSSCFISSHTDTHSHIQHTCEYAVKVAPRVVFLPNSPYTTRWRRIGCITYIVCKQRATLFFFNILMYVNMSENVRVGEYRRTDMCGCERKVTDGRNRISRATL